MISVEALVLVSRNSSSECSSWKRLDDNKSKLGDQDDKLTELQIYNSNRIFLLMPLNPKGNDAVIDERHIDLSPLIAGR